MEIGESGIGDWREKSGGEWSEIEKEKRGGRGQRGLWMGGGGGGGGGEGGGGGGESDTHTQSLLVLHIPTRAYLSSFQPVHIYCV